MTKITKLVDGRFNYTYLKAEQILNSLPELIENINFQVECLTLHWSAGAYHDSSGYYHFNIGGDQDSNGYLLTSQAINTRWHYHLPFNIQNRPDIPNRNPGNLGLSFLAMAGATINNMGAYPITPQMIEVMAKTLAVLKKQFNLKWDRIVDHAYWAKIDGYASYRWDCQYKLTNGKTVTEESINKAMWYHEKYLKG